MWTCEIYTRKSALLLFKLLMVIFKALKKFWFLFACYCYIYHSHLTSYCSHSSQQLQLVRVCLLADLNLNTSSQTQHQMKSLAKSSLTSLGMRPTGGARLQREACITAIHILLSSWEQGQGIIWRQLQLCFIWQTTSLLFCKILRDSASSKASSLDDSVQTVLGQPGCRLAVSGKVQAILCFLMHSHS